MKKTFDVEDIDCAVCAQKLEDGIKKIDGVQNANVNFITQKLTLECSDESFDEILKKVIKTAKKIEPDCRIKL